MTDITDEQIKRWAEECEMSIGAGLLESGEFCDYFEAWPEQLRRFAELARQVEAEACAKLMEEEMSDGWDCSALIRRRRARGSDK